MDNIYQNISKRTQGDIYIGVVGPVRTGKSTFIKRFMETVVIPNIDNVYSKERARDELPQSGSGKTIMTAEPKFVPEDAVSITLDGKSYLNVRMIDCVGYMVKGAIGITEDDTPRMVHTPWCDHEIPMAEAAEIGTRKVIEEHSTIGIVITTDGSITDIPRDDYLEAESRVICELKEIGKPFIVLVNAENPNSEEVTHICNKISEEHDVTCIGVNCTTITEPEIRNIIKEILYEFPVYQLEVNMPSWVESLPHGHSVKTELYGNILHSASKINKIKDITDFADSMKECSIINDARISSIDLGTGIIVISGDMPRSLFYDILSCQTGFNIQNDGDLLPLLSEMSGINSEYKRVAEALNQVRETGYGIVLPNTDELKLEEPEIVKQGGQYGVRLRASAPSIHMLRADITTEVAPIVGSEKQSEELVVCMLKEFENEPEKIWESNIFGKSLHDLVNEGLHNKLYKMPQDARMKLKETVERITNESCSGLICIII